MRSTKLRIAAVLAFVAAVFPLLTVAEARDYGMRQVPTPCPSENEFSGKWSVLVGESDPARLTRPTAIGFDQAGRVLIADQSASAIKVFSREGDPLGFYGAQDLDGRTVGVDGLIVGPDDLLYLSTADTEDQIQQRDAAGGLVKTWRKVTRSFQMDSSGNVYTYWRAAKSPGLLTKLSPTSERAWQRNVPSNYGFAVGPDGTAYIDNSSKIIRFDTDGNELEPFDGAAGASWNGRILLIGNDRQGSVYIMSEASLDIIKLSPVGEVLSHIVPPSEVSIKSEVYNTGWHARAIFDENDNMYLLIRSQDRAYKISPSGQLLAAFGVPPDTTGVLGDPSALASDSNGNVLVLDHRFSRIQRFSPEGVTLDEIRLASLTRSEVDILAGVGANQDGTIPLNLQGLALDSADNIYVSQSNVRRVVKLSPAGEQLATFSVPDMARPDLQWSPGPLVIDHSANLIVAESSRGVTKLTPSGEIVWRRDWSPFGTVPVRGLAVDLDGKLYAVAYPAGQSDTVFRFSTEGEPNGRLGNQDQKSPSISLANSVSIDGAGNLFVADASRHPIKKFSPTGRLLGCWGTWGGDNSPGNFAGTGPMTIDRSGNLFVVDRGNQRIQQLSGVASN